MSDAATARTVEVFWNYQTPACNKKAPSLSSVPTTLGATYMASAGIGSGDFSLIQLSSLPNASLVFYGWNASADALQVGDKATGIHHPSADYKRISFGVRDPDRTAQIGSEIAPSNLYYQIRETAGRIEPGSSGSPLFTQDKTVVGTLTYGPAGNACSISPFSAGYARFSAAYPSLSAYLSPPPPSGNPGAGSPPPPAVTVSATPASIHSGWTINGASPAAQTIQLATTSASAVTLTARASQPWILLSAASVTVSLATPAALTVSLNVQAFSAAGSYSGSVTLSATGVTQSIPVQVDVTAAVAAVKGGPVTVIPLFQDSVGVSTSFTLANPYGTATNASISFAAANGATVTVPVGQSQASSWQNVTIPAFGTVTVTTAGSSTPPKQGIAVIQSGDAAKRVQALALINSDVVPAALPVAPPLVVPFDATSSATTTLYIYNASTTDITTLTLTIHDTSGSVAGTGQITIPPQQEGTIAMFRSAAVFGGHKGLLYVNGRGSLLVMGIRTASDGRLSGVIPAAVAQ
jgi:hypothetical protein